jgi:hypothetical protein
MSESYNQDVKKQFIDGYQKYLDSDELLEIVKSVVIPNFEIIACELEYLIDDINETTDNKNQVLDYIEMIFNSKLYDSILDIHKKSNEEHYLHYLIILIEFIKYEKYQNIKNTLSNFCSTDKKPIIFDTLHLATDERANYCLDKIRSTFNDLVKNYPNFMNSIDACKNLLESNNIKLF